MQKIKIKYFTDKIEPLDYIEGKSDWIDMRASEEVTLKEGTPSASRRPVRPLPDVDYFFENQWRIYRERMGMMD